MNQHRSPRNETARLAAESMVCTVDHLASSAGARLLAEGGNAADAAIAASAALAVTTQHMCGMGGDLWALVHQGDAEPLALNASGRMGSGADADRLRSEGHTVMPYRGDVRSVPIPGCVDGWLALHERCGRLPLGDVLAPAIEIAGEGFAASAHLVAAAPLIAEVEGADDYRPIDGAPLAAGQRITRPGLARSLQAIVEEGRKGWYEGEFGQGLLRIGAGLYADQDLAQVQAAWEPALAVEAWGHTIWTVPPNSQGYLSLAGAAIAAGLELPDDSSDPGWAHLLIESAKQAGYDRTDSLYDGADGVHLLSEERLAPRRDAIDPAHASRLYPPGAGGGTIYLCAVDSDRMGVSLIQSNAAGFGAHLAVPEVGVFLHNRGIGFTLDPGHPAEYGPGRRPPSTLSPALVTSPGGSLRTVLGTMGGDGQPQVVLQMLARLLQAGDDAGWAVTAPRFTLTVAGGGGFDTWHDPAGIEVGIEEGSGWGDDLRTRGHVVDERPWGTSLFGHAHLIDVADDHLRGVAEPRVGSAAAIGR